MYKFLLFLTLTTSLFAQNDIIGKEELIINKTPVYEKYNENYYLHNILAHCPNKSELINLGFNDNLVTWGHEATHQINAFNSVYSKQQAIYVMTGHVMIKDPQVRIENISRLIPQKLHDHLYNLYFIETVRINRNHRLKALGDDYIGTMYLFDEMSAYINGSFIKEQYKLSSDESEIENAYKFTLYCGYVLYYLDTKGIQADPQIKLLYQHQYYRLKSLRSDEKYRRILKNSEISNFLEKILDI